MIAKAGKKILATMLALTLVLGNVPAIAFAASAETNPLQDGTLVVSEEGNVTVNEDKGSVLVVATPNADSSSMIPFYEGTTETVTLTNKSDAQQILSFDYSVQGNLKSLTIGGKAYTGTGTWTGVVESSASVDVVLSGNDTDGLVKVGMGNFAFHDNQGKLVDVVASKNGTVTEGMFKDSYEIGVPVEATAAEGYQFVAWVDENNQILSTEVNTTLHPVASCTVTAVFAATEEPYFKAAGKLFADLNEAAEYAKASGTGVVVPMKDGTVPAGDYTIPSGVTLLVPFDVAETCYLDKGQTAGTEFTEPATYCKLTFADGANLTVNGELSVSAKHTSGYNSTKTGGTPTESVGMIDLKEGSTITIADGASAYAWGYIIGSGNMVAESGSKIYEIMQIADFRGGTQTKNLLSTVVLPFSQYYIQNIEAPLTLHGGAEEYAFTTLTATLGVTVTASAGIKFIGTEDAMFALEEGTTVTKTYDPATDRLMLETNGNFALNSMTLNVLGQNLGTEGFNLPINNNISIDIQSGNAVIKQNTAFQPGAEVSVGENASVSVAQQVDENGDSIPTNLYIYDADDWGGFTFGGNKFTDIAYSPTKTYTRTVEKDIKDVVIDINGRFVVEQNAYVYATAGGAQVISSKGTGSVEFNNIAGSLPETKQADGAGTIVNIPITPMKMQNQNGSYVATASVAAGDGFVVDNGTWIPATDVTLTYDANDGTFVGDEGSDIQTLKKAQVLAGTKTTLKKAGNLVERKGYVFKGWNTAADGSGTFYADEAVVRLVKDTTLYAQWEGQSYTLTFVNYDNSVIEKITAPFGTPITYPEVPRLDGYTFSKWSDDTVTTMPEGDRTIKAVHTPNQYTITFDSDGGSAVDSITQGYNTTLKEPTAPTKEGYTFTGWEPAFPEKMPLGGMELKATWELTKNTISFDTDGGSAVADIKGYYGEAVTKPADPTKEGYTFTGWEPAFPETMPAEDLKLTAQWTPNQYTITFNTDGGSTIDPITQNYNSLVAAPAAPVREGYTFIGWDQDVPGKMPAKDVTLKAQWKVNQYTITFDTDGGSEVADMTVDFGAKVEAPAAPVKEGYTFKGWDADIPETMPAEDLQLRAKWEINQYTVTFDTDGGSQIAAVKKDFGTEITLSSPTKEGFIFRGWECDGKLTGSNFTIPAHDVTLKAIWEEDAAVVVTFADDDGKEYQVTGKKGQAMTIPQIPAREGYTLTWAPEVPATFPAQDTTYFAVWNINQYTITFDTDGGSKVNPVTADYGAQIVAPAAPEKEGYVFKGWSPALPKTMPAQNMTVKATYHKVVIDPAVEATCTSTGLTEGKHCADCDEVFVKQVETPMLKHKEEVLAAKAATTAGTGLTEGKKCSVCGTVTVAQETVAAIDTVKLSYDKKVYTGKTLAAPELTVTDTAGNPITSYTVTGLTGKKSVGRYKVTVTFQGNYAGSEDLYFNIVPKKTSSVKAALYGYDDVKFSWSKVTGASGYLVYYKAGSGKWSKGVATTSTSYKKANLSDGVKYTFKVVPYYKTKTSTTKYYDANQYKSTTIYTLKKVAGVKVAKSGTKVKVSWTNISGETGYQISKMTKKSATQKTPLTYKTTSGKYKKLTATKGKTYYYKVRAYKQEGKTKIYGPWSVVKSYKRR